MLQVFTIFLDLSKSDKSFAFFSIKEQNYKIFTLYLIKYILKFLLNGFSILYTLSYSYNFFSPV